MSNRRLLITSAMAAAILTYALVVSGVAHADTTQPVFSTQGTTNNTGYSMQLGTGYSGTISSVSVFVGYSYSSSWGNPVVNIDQYTDGTYGTQDGTCTINWGSTFPPGSATSTVIVANVGSSSGLGCTVDPRSYVTLSLSSGGTSGGWWIWYGTGVAPSWVTVTSAPGGDPVAVPYFDIAGLYGGPAGSPNWNAITTPPPFTLGASASAIAASSSLWGSISLASSSLQCSTGNAFSDALCSAGAFLFIPAPSVLEQYAELPETESTHFPFSWLYQVQTTLNNATSTTGNLPAYSLDLYNAASTTFASTTMPNFMPSFTFFSSSTVMTYLPSADWSALQSLLAAVLWLGLVADIFFTLRNRFHRA